MERPAISAETIARAMAIPEHAHKLAVAIRGCVAANERLLVALDEAARWVPPPPPEQDRMTVVDAAASLGLAASTVRRQVVVGSIAATKLGRDWWIETPEIERYRAMNLGKRGRRPKVRE